MRNNPTQLPNKEEIEEILRAESKRMVPKSKESVHYPDFSSIINLLQYFSIPTDIFNNSANLTMVEKSGPLIIQDATSKIILNKKIPEVIKLLDDIYSYLSEEDPLKKSDFIFVFGSKAKFRIEKAIEIYKHSLADKIIISGKNPIYEIEVKKSESESHKEYALQQGIEKESLLVEENSITIPDNVKSSLNLLDKGNLMYESFILINSPFSQRRGWSHFKKFTSDEIKLVRINADVSEKFSKNNWYKQDNTIQIVLNEFVKMKIATILNTA